MPSRCLTLTATLLVLAVASPLAAAQFPEFGLASTPEAREVLAGENATYAISVTNPALLPRSAQMSLVSALPPGWTFSFSVDPVEVPAGGEGATALTIYVPADAQPQSLTIVYEANDGSNSFRRDEVELTIRAPDAPPSPGTQTLGAPQLRLTASAADSAPAGSTARGQLTLENVDPARATMTATIALAGSDGWSAFLRAADTTRILDFGRPVTLDLFAEVPELAENTTKTFTISVAVEGTTFLAHWSVLGIAREATEPSTPGEDGAAATSSPSPSVPTTRGPLGPSGPNLEVLVAPLEIDIPANGEATATVLLSNTGNTPLVVALSGSPPPTWRPIVFTTQSIALAPGERADVPITLYAPDVPPGGRAAASITATTTNGLARGADFVLTVVAGAPRDTTTAAAIEAPSTTEGGLPAAGTTALVVVGLAAVGGAAAFVVNRPLREKLLWGAAGLYTRLARPDVLGHEDREKLYRLVETQPGIHFHALQRDLGWNTGTLTYHLRVLEKHGFMVSRRDGLYRRFYLSGAAPRKEVFENQGPTGLRADVMEAVRNQPGISQSDLALGLGANKQTVNYHVKALERAGTIRVEKRGRDTFLYPAEAPATSGPGVARV